ncbi:MAG: SMC-Scp complex subunit ScpB [Planctomycetes bacterium]|nr:SMC-Scp complex subunit ScpB [Planctomycetota bacterium]
MTNAHDAPSDPVDAEQHADPEVDDRTSEPLVETLDADQVAELKAELDGGGAASVDEPLVIPDVADLPPSELRAVVESLLFVATRPLSVERLAGCLPGTSEVYLASFLEGLAARYDHENRGWELRRIANGWQLLTRRAHHAWVRQLERKELPTRLSKSALETLAIVAYKQPVTRGAVEDIRGVQCGPVLRQLMDLKLVAVVGRNDDQLGRPLLYGTTESFLTRFGLGAIADLPKKHEFGA